MFLKAVPIWLNGLQTVMNVQASFVADVTIDDINNVKLRITGATLYTIRINGKFVGYGPARAPHGYARVDEIDISSDLFIGKNHIEIEVAGYNCASYYTRQQLSFVCAEIINEDFCIAYTGKDFNGIWKKTRLQKVMRYSFQRPFTEVYDYRRSDIAMDIVELRLQHRYIERQTALPEYRVIRNYSIKEEGYLIEIEKEDLKKDRSITNISTILKGYHEDELEACPYYELQKRKFVKDQVIVKGQLPLKITSGNYILIDMGRNVTGFIQSLMKVNKDSHIILTFDEKLINGTIDYNSVDMVNMIDYHLIPQENAYELESFEVYGFRYIAVLVIDGEVILEDFGVRSYQYPIPEKELSLEDEDLQQIYTAARETFSQNTLDVFMDCPTRERAGWLCDSYFTAQAEYCITGRSDVERVFMNNFILTEYHANVPKGMLPMCYPAEHLDGIFIPQWSMWYIIELEQFLKRCPDENPKKFKKLCYDMIGFFEEYRNTDGLLEKLPSWNFVEWSRANEWVYDVNYPTNMLYAKVLEIVGDLYDDNQLLEECRQIRHTVIKQSYNGKLFTDHSIRDDFGNLYNPGDISEVCQYYAIRFGLISIDDPNYQTLRNYVRNIFGKANNDYESLGNIEPANVLMGIYLRMEILLEMKEYKLLLSEIKQYFGGMAEYTGTLWEFKNMIGSLNHGFASYVSVVIEKIFYSQED